MVENNENLIKLPKPLPLKRFKSGPVSCSIWETEIMVKNNTGETFPKKIHHISIQRSYRDKQTGEWKNSGIIPLDNIPDVIALLQYCYNYIKIKDITTGQNDFETARINL